MWNRRHVAWILLGVALLAAPAPGQHLPVDGEALLDEVSERTAETFFDPEMRGVAWAETVERYRERLRYVETREEAGMLLNEMLGALRTSHTRYFHQEDPRFYELLDVFSSRPGPASELATAIFGDQVVRMPSIGVVTESIEGRTFIVDVLHGSPADRSGLLIGDEIVGVEGKPFHPIYSLVGRAGAPIPLEIRRSRDAEPEVVWVDVEIVMPHEAFERDLRESVRVVERGQARVGYVRVYSFAGEQYYMALKSVLREAPLSDADALVIDLRGGWGGAQPEYLHAFSRRVPRLSFRGRDGAWRDVGTGEERAGLEPAWTRSVVMLVDAGSRSGKEILAHGFKTYGVGVLVGERTAGAVVGGSAFPLSNGDLVYVAVSDVRVDGVRLEGVGVEPHVEIGWDRRFAAGVDPQFETAAAVAAGLAFGEELEEADGGR